MQGGVSSWRRLGAPLATAQSAEQARGPWSLQTGLSSGTEVPLKAAGRPHALQEGGGQGEGGGGGGAGQVRCPAAARRDPSQCFTEGALD